MARRRVDKVLKGPGWQVALQADVNTEVQVNTGTTGHTRSVSVSSKQQAPIEQRRPRGGSDVH